MRLPLLGAPGAIVLDVRTPVEVAAVTRGGYILDGFPRTLPQATAAAELVAVDAHQPPEAVTTDILTRLSDLSLIGDYT